MRRLMKAATTLLLVVMLGGCAAGKTRGWVVVGVTGANYTEDYIVDVSIQDLNGKRFGIGIAHIKEFSRGGTSGNECCASIPGVGQAIQVAWKVEGRQTEDQWKTFSREVVVAGQASKNPSRHSYLIVRFFPNREIEAELIPGDDPRGARHPRMDKLFIVGPRVMRQKGE